jgi:hypothetical protein
MSALATVTEQVHERTREQDQERQQFQQVRTVAKVKPRHCRRQADS